MSTITTSPALPDLVSARAAAKALGCSVATINRRIDAGALEAVDISGPGGKRPVRRIKRESLESLLRPISPKASDSPFTAALAELVSAAPRLTDEQAARIGEILRTGGE